MNELHEFIKSLDPAELSFLKKNAEKKGQSSAKYLEVMDAIRAQPVYDEAALLKKFRREKFVKQFSVMKNYLFHVIADTLTAKNLIDEPQNCLVGVILRIHFFKDKGLYALAESELKSGLKIATETEAFVQELELLSIQRYLIINRFSSDSYDTLITNQKLTQDTLALYQNLLDYTNLHAEFTLLLDKSFNANAGKSSADFEAIFSNAMIQDESKALSKRALLEALLLKTAYYNITHQTDLFFEMASRAFDLAHQSEWHLSFDKMRLLSTYHQKMHAAWIVGRLNEIKDTLEKLNSFKPQNEVQELAAFCYFTSFSLVYFQHTHENEKLLEAIHKAYQLIKERGAKLRFDVRKQLIISCMSGAIESGEYVHALDWSLLYRAYDTNNRLDMRMVIEMMELIAHTELKNIVLVHNLSQGIYQRALRWGEKGGFESVFISFFKKLSTSIDPDEKIKVFEKSKEDLNKLSDEHVSSQHQALYAIFNAYLASKIAGKPYHLFMKNFKS